LGRILLKGGLVFTAEAGAAPATKAIVLKDDRIEWVGPPGGEAAVGPFETTLDLQGKFVLPGLIDSHTHLAFNGHESLFKLYADPHDKLAFEAVNSVATTLLSGVTTARDTGGWNYMDVSLKRHIMTGLIAGPRMIVSGKMIAATGGHCHVIADEADGVAEFRKAARRQIKNGSDLVKLMVTGGGATPGQSLNATQLEVDEIKAAAEVAHSNERKACAHAHGATGIKRCVLGGVDAVEHASLLDQEAAEMMAEKGVVMVMTPGHEAMFPNIDPDWTRRMLPLRSRAAETLRIARQAGVKIVLGSDSGGNPYAPHGHFMVILDEAVKAGFTPVEALLACTSRAAEALGAAGAEIGVLAPGKKADVLVLEASPLVNIRNAAKVAAVFKDGKLVNRPAYLPADSRATVS
jgi:imidazolonepropionase-like amidohydrolase